MSKKNGSAKKGSTPFRWMKRMDILMPQLMKATGATEELKAANPMKWVGLANACKAQAEELVLTELICC